MVDVFVSVTATAPQAAASGTITKLSSLSLTEITPTGAPSPWHNGNSRFEIQTGWDGIYCLNACGQWTTTFTQSCLLQARVNNTDTYNLMQIPGSPDTSGAILNGVRFIRLAAGDYLDIRVRQVSGSSRNFQLDEATLQWVRS